MNKDLMVFVLEIIYPKWGKSDLAMYFKGKETEQCVIPPLLFGLGVETNHATGLKTLLTQLSKLEYTISHDEVK